MNTHFKNIIVLLILSIVLVGCEIGFLDQVSLSDITTEFFYNTEEDLEQALVGCYYKVSGRGNQLKEGNFAYGVNIIGECGTDEIYANHDKISAQYPQVHALDKYSTLVSTNLLCQEIWINHYEGIMATNKILDVIWKKDSLELDETPRLREIAAEAAFLQALWYFNLVRIYGGVPLVTRPITADDDVYSFGRNSIEKVYERIHFLLDYAKEYLPDIPSKNGATQYGRSRKLSAYGLSAKVNLQIASSMNLLDKTMTDDIRLITEQYPEGINSYNWKYKDVNTNTYLSNPETIKKYYELARDDANYVLINYGAIHGGKYLNDNFTDCFYPSESTDEILFEAILSSGFAQDMSGWFGSIYGPRGQSKLGGGQHVLFPNNGVVLNTFTFRFAGTPAAPDYVSEGVQIDKRFTWTMATMNIADEITPIKLPQSFKQFELGKFRVIIEETPNQDRTAVNNPVLRVAETCLIYAEALAELNELNNPGSNVPDEALEFVNVVRTRAGLTNYLYDHDDGANSCDYKSEVLYTDIATIGNKEIKGYSSTVTYANGTPIGHFRRAIMNERMLELIGEGHRFYDLVRMGMLVPVLEALNDWLKDDPNGKFTVYNVDGTATNVAIKDDLIAKNERAIKPFHIFRPVPNREIVLHKNLLEQNFGY